MDCSRYKPGDEKTLTVGALRELVRDFYSQKKQPQSDADADESDKEREALADLHESHKGKPSPVEVTDEDLPEGLMGDDESDDDEEAEQSGVDAAEKKYKKKGK